MTDWDPDLYRRFETERTRPAEDSLARVPLDSVDAAVDLGCGPGNSTELVARRYGPANITGIDNSAAMIAAARARLPGARFVQADIAGWTAAEPPDLVFANASLHWVPDHARLIPRLLAQVAPGGALAVQIPDNLHERSHTLMAEVAADPLFALAGADPEATRARILSAEEYYDLLIPGAGSIEIWRTTYHHLLPSPQAMSAWLRATGLRPYLEPLSKPLQAEFLARFEAGLDRAYPMRADGTRLFPFPRLFIVALRR